MDDQAGEDDDYSDDDLDALPDHAFHQLQENAIQSTQPPSLSAQVQLPTINQPGGLANGLGRMSVEVDASHSINQHAFQAPSSDYGDFDEEMLDGEIFDAAEEPTLAARYDAIADEKEPGEYARREQWRLQRYGANQFKPEPIEAQQLAHQQGAVGVPSFNDNNLAGPNAKGYGARVVHLENQEAAGPPPQEFTDVKALQAQVQKVGLLKTQFYRTWLLTLLFSCYMNVKRFNRPYRTLMTMLFQKLAKSLSYEPMQRKSKRSLRIERWPCRNFTPMKQRDKRLK